MLHAISFIWKHPISGRSRSKSLLRYLRWQVGSRFLSMPVIVPWIDGSSLVIETGMTGATGNHYCGLHEFEDMALLLHVLRRGDLFLDVGANVGTYTILAVRVVGARAIAMEPVPSTFRKLLRNISCNAIDEHVIAQQAAAGAHADSEIWFSVDRDTVNQAVDESYAGEKERVPIVRLDSVLADREPVMWKVDVEGFEEQVLAGAEQALSRPTLQVVLLEAHTAEITATMSRHGFTLVNYDPWSRSCRTVQAARGPNTSKNHLWVRDKQWLEERCRAARRYFVHGVEF